jgi:hypothetical protein
MLDGLDTFVMNQHPEESVEYLTELDRIEYEAWCRSIEEEEGYWEAMDEETERRMQEQLELDRLADEYFSPRRTELAPPPTVIVIQRTW